MPERLEVVDGVSSGAFGYIDEVHETSRSAQVAQEAIAEPSAFARSRDQTGHIGQDEGALFGNLHDAEMRHEGREGIIRDLGSRAADSRDERRLPGIRKADEADIREQPQLEPNATPHARAPRFAFSRRPIRRRCKGRIPSSPAPALSDEQPLIFVGQISEELSCFRIVHESAEGN